MAENFSIILQEGYLEPEFPFYLYVLLRCYLKCRVLYRNNLRRYAYYFSSPKDTFKVRAHGFQGVSFQPSTCRSFSWVVSTFPSSQSFSKQSAIDRFLVLHLAHYRSLVTPRRVVKVLVFVWIWRSTETCLIIYDHLIFNIMANIGLGVSMFIITACYLKSYLTLRRKDENVKGMISPRRLENSGQRERTRVRKNSFNLVKYKRSVYTMLYIYVTFILCWYIIEGNQSEKHLHHHLKEKTERRQLKDDIHCKWIKTPQIALKVHLLV